MFTERDLRELLNYKAQHPVLSVYLNTDPAQGSADFYRLRLRSMLKDIDLKDDAAAVERYFSQEFNWSGRSVAVFSCQPEDFLRAYTFAVPLRDRLRISDHPHVKPLADLLDSFGGYGVALVDKQSARLFYFHLGELREKEGLVGESVRHTKRGGASAAPGRRGGTAGQTNYMEEVTERNLKEAADFAAHFFAENNVRRVLVGGTDENVVPFKNYLPKAWQSLVVGNFPMSMTASHAEVMNRALEIGQQAEIEREAQLMDAVVTGAAKGRGGVIDLEDTLNGTLERMLQGDDPIGFQTERLDRFDIQGIREIGGPEFDEPEFFLEVGIRLGTGIRHGAAPVAGNQANREAFGFLRAPLGVDVYQTRCRNIAQVQQGVFGRGGDGLADTINLPAIDREIGTNFVATRDALLFLAGDAINLFGTGFGHFHQVMEMLLDGVVG